MGAFMDKFSEGVIWYVVFLFSTVCHEAAHAWVALKMGDPTAYEGGQVSLNPVPHMKREPFGTIFVPIFTFFSAGWMMGWASTPYNFRWALAYPKRSALMSLAGPAANLVLTLVAGLLIRAGMAAGIFRIPDFIGFTSVTEAVQPGFFSEAAVFLSVLFFLNLLLFTFNLLPFPPLDGSGVVMLFIGESAAQRYLAFIHRTGLALLAFLVAWKFFYIVFDPVQSLALGLLYPGAGFR